MLPASFLMVNQVTLYRLSVSLASIQESVLRVALLWIQCKGGKHCPTTSICRQRWAVLGELKDASVLWGWSRVYWREGRTTIHDHKTVCTQWQGNPVLMTFCSQPAWSWELSAWFAVCWGRCKPWKPQMQWASPVQSLETYQPQPGYFGSLEIGWICSSTLCSCLIPHLIQNYTGDRLS